MAGDPGTPHAGDGGSETPTLTRQGTAHFRIEPEAIFNLAREIWVEERHEQSLWLIASAFPNLSIGLALNIVTGKITYQDLRERYQEDDPEVRAGPRLGWAPKWFGNPDPQP